jgi:hypothetical protein
MVQIHSPRPLFPDSTIYAAFSTSGFASFLRTIRTTSVILLGSSKPGCSGLWLPTISQEELDVHPQLVLQGVRKRTAKLGLCLQSFRARL